MIDKQSESESLDQNNNVENIKKQTSEVICRVFFVRHGKTDLEWKSAQLSDAQLSEEWIVEIHALGKRLKKLWCNKENTLLLCRPGEKNQMKRIVESKEILEQYTIGTYESEILLDTTEKIEEIDPETWQQQIKSSKEHHHASGDKYSEAGILMEKIRTQEQYSKYKHIVLLGHKSNDALLEILQGKKEKEETVLNPWRVKIWVIYEWDLNQNKEYSNYEKQKEILYINNKNIAGIVNVLKYEEELRGYIESFFKKELKVFELQNSINTYFSHHPELYDKYFISGNSVLMLFCLANLIQGKNNKIIEANFAKAINIFDNDNFDETAKTIWELILKSGEDVSLYTDLFLRTLYVDEKIDDHLSSYIKAQVKDKQEILTQIEYYESLMKHHEKHIQPNISEIRNKSLDERYHTNNQNKEIDNNFDLWDKNIEENCLKILDNNQTVVIEWDWWSGKSFFSVYFQEQLRNNYFRYNNTSYFPIYIQLKWKEWANVEEEIKEQEKYATDTKKEKIYFFESLDESEFCNESGIKTFLDYIQKNDLKSVINTRAWYLDTNLSDAEKLNIKKYSIKWMKDTMKYVENCFDGNKKDIEKYKQLQKQIWEEYMQKNSLFVTILCELIQEWGENLEKIDSKWKLFGAIVEQRLSKWEGRKNCRKPTVNTKNENSKNQFDKEIQDRLRVLEKIAYYKSNNWGKIDEKDMGSITALDHESLSFLFKKNDQGEFGFIHQSFEDYFLLKYFIKRPDKLEEIIKKSQEKNKNDNMKILLIATKEWYKEIMELLVNSWYNYNEKNKYWTNVFMFACLRWDIEMVELLIDKIDDIDETDDKNRILSWTIRSACEGWNLEILKLLYNRNKIKKMWPSLICACRSNQIEMLEWLFDKFKDSIKKEEIKCIFLNTCFDWHLEIAKRLYDKCWYDKYENRNEKRFELEKAFNLANKYDIIERLYYKISDLELDHMLYIERISWVTYWTSQSSIEKNIDILNISLEELNKRLSVVQKQWYKEITKLLQAKINKLNNKQQ